MSATRRIAVTNGESLIIVFLDETGEARTQTFEEIDLRVIPVGTLGDAIAAAMQELESAAASPAATGARDGEGRT